ncbi:MAG TPA: LamG-like jellyroll fold domain-containing protein [Verrucomicrobiae bacterium]|nr:LamG-like jellyroll fold domain-containing protein [Verrucomicrobiae bacterium]
MTATFLSARRLSPSFLCTLWVAFACARADARLVAHWTFDENGGAIAHDSAGPFHGALSGGAMFVDDGVSGNALRFDRESGSLANMGTAFPNFTAGDFSIALWIKTTTTERESLFLGKHEAGTLNGYLMTVNTSSTYGEANKIYFYDSTMPGGEATSTTTINDGNWHHVVGVYDADGTLGIYVDGAPIEAVKASQPILANGAPFLLGGANFDGTPRGMFTGLLDDVQVYDHALSSAEVQFLFIHPGRVMTSPTTLIVNPSFEFDPVPPGAGYGTITGWTPGGGIDGGSGINEFGMPFAGNGAVPDGTKVAFLQHNGTLSQDISGFRVGAQYWLTYRENARQGCCGGTALLAVRIGNETIVTSHRVTPVGGTNPYRIIGSTVFTAPQETRTLTFSKNGDGDTTALIDLVEIMEVPPNSPPGVTENPASQRGDSGESVTFTAAAVGTAPMFFQWWFNGAKLDGETNRTLTRRDIGPAQAGTYWFVVANAAGSARSSDANLTVRTGVPIVRNPSFEQDPIPPFPGYGTITGWMPSVDLGTSYGINPMNGAFCDNGAVPHGAKVAFLQHNGALAQTVSGFNVGAQYWLTYRENARQNCCGGAATLSVTVGDIRVVGEHTVAAVGGVEPFRLLIGQPFTATEPDLTIVFEKGGTGDATALIDDVRIFPLDNFKVGISLKDGSVRAIRINGAPGETVMLEYKDSLLSTAPWLPLTNVPVVDWIAAFLDGDASAAGPRFYRATHTP